MPAAGEAATGSGLATRLCTFRERSLAMSTQITRKPWVLVPACNRMLGEHAFHVVGQKYVDAVALAGCQALIVAGGEAADLPALLELADGVLLTGSLSNVHPRWYGEELRDRELPLDHQRDQWVLPLIPQVLARGIPLLAICRGFQETNVALGGSLHQAVHETPPFADHRSAADAMAAQAYGPAHVVNIVPGGVLSALLAVDAITVNSLHGQGLDRLAPGLRVEARAPDGLVEACSVADAPGFNLCVQWHPEWNAVASEVSMRLLRGFGDACRRYRDQRDKR